MLIVVKSKETANQLRNSMNTGNCIVLYHRTTCPYCVQMMPEWEKFKKQAKAIQGLTVGEVEGSNMEYVPESSSISSVPSIKFYRVPNGTNGPVVPKEPQQPKVLNLIQNMIARTKPTPVPASSQSEVMFQEPRTASNLVKFARQNLANVVGKINTGPKTMRRKGPPAQKKPVVTRKRRGRPPGKKAPAASVKSSSYNNAKSNDTMVMSNLKKLFKKL